MRSNVGRVAMLACVAGVCAACGARTGLDAGTIVGVDDATPGPTPTPTLWSAWPMRRHDPGRTARSDLVGPRRANPIWTTPFGASSHATPRAVGPDGTLYVAVTELEPAGARATSNAASRRPR